MTLPPIEIAITDEEAVAVNAFWEYGATRGNHQDGTGNYPGPLSDYIAAMGRVARKLWPLVVAGTPEEVVEWNRRSEWAKTHPETNVSMEDMRARIVGSVQAVEF